jgi:hypothetical protein
MIELPSRFDDIRPYYDCEIPEAMARIVSDPLLPGVVRYLGKEDILPQIKSRLLSISSAEELQREIMHPVIKRLIDSTTDGFTYDGIANVDPSAGLLYVANHRDIVLDSFLQQLALVENGIPTSHITFGSNLMRPQFVVDIGKSNKMFKTVRKCSDPDLFIESSLHLSDYIRYVVTHGESVWIAQRNGRTKDGIDKTDQGLLRMLMLGRKDTAALNELKITPVAISYQWESCDMLKAVELYKSMNGKPYVKAPGEDLSSIITGLVQQKGKVHVSVRPTLDPELFQNENLRRSDIEAAVRRIDEEIYAGYRLWDTNFIGYDLLNSTTRFSDRYEKEILEAFVSRMEKSLDGYPEIDRDALRRIFLGIYAGPVTTSPDISL